ncbi:MAG: SIMPL domain-containing protein [Epulopiscium sp.]|nr:SIMPL domain-containing protein [Candidatus Epulonipiscium sp.]
MKKNAKTLLILLAVIFTTFSGTLLVQASEIKMGTNTIQTNGKATINVKPDMAIISAYVNTENRDAKKAQEENAKQINKIKEEISAKYNLKEEDIRTVSYNIRPNYDYIDGKQVFKNYIVRHSLAVNVEDVDKTGEMLDSLVSSGATGVDNIQFGIKDDKETYNLALQKAIANSQEKADAITKALGVGKAKPIAITEKGESMGITDDYNIMVEEMQADGAYGTNIFQNDIEITARVEVIFKW